MFAKNAANNIVLNESDNPRNQYQIVNKGLGYLFTESTHPNNFWCVKTSEEDVENSFSIEAFLKVETDAKCFNEARKTLIQFLIDAGYNDWLTQNGFIQKGNQNEHS